MELYETRDLSRARRENERTKQRRSILRSLEEQKEHGDCLIHETWNPASVRVSALRRGGDVRRGPRTGWGDQRLFGLLGDRLAVHPFALGDSFIFFVGPRPANRGTRQVEPADLKFK